MSLGTLFRDALAGLVRRPATVQYPAQRQPAPALLRDALVWDPANCTGCGLCVKDCPSSAIEWITLTRAAKRFVLHYQADRRVFCSQCVQNWRFKCSELSPAKWELAALTKESFTLH